MAVCPTTLALNFADNREVRGKKEQGRRRESW
jgi:hypothetical protein